MNNRLRRNADWRSFFLFLAGFFRNVENYLGKIQMGRGIVLKRLLAFFLILMFLAGVSIAESSPDRAFTADEQAYDVYLDVSYVHNQSVRYLSEMERLWDLANDLDSVSDADKLWFHAGLVANFGNNDAETLSRLYAYQHLATVKYGYSQIPELYPLFEALLSAGGRKTTDSIWAGLALDIEAQYIVSPDEMKAYMDDAKEGIRNIMSTDRSYPYLQDLQNYYKEASYLLDYISDFKDNYLGLKEMLDTQKKNQSSYSIDFEFIFDSADFNYVMEVRAAETAEKQREVYDRALALENIGDYAGAIGLYWQCYNYTDASDCICRCHERIKREKETEQANTLENKYQDAIQKEGNGDYKAAFKLYDELDDYKDSIIRAKACLLEIQAYSRITRITNTTVGASGKAVEEIVYVYDDKGFPLSEKCNSALPYSEEYILDADGFIMQGKRSGQWSSDERRTITADRLYDEHGNVICETTTYRSYDNWLHKDGEIKQINYEYVYDQYGNVVSRKSFEKLELISEYTNEYTYDVYGRIVTLKSYQGRYIYENSYTYNSDGLVASIIETPYLDGQPAGYHVETEYFYAYFDTKRTHTEAGRSSREAITQNNTENAEPAAVAYSTLKPGSKGQAVLDARMKLYELGYFSKKPTQTEYTENMKDYVRKFEKDNGLKQDGILSPEDQEVLFGL